MAGAVAPSRGHCRAAVGVGQRLAAKQEQETQLLPAYAPFARLQGSECRWDALNSVQTHEFGEPFGEP